MEEGAESVGPEEINKAMDLIIETCEINSIPHGAILGSCFNIICRILQSRNLHQDSIVGLACHFDQCLREISAKITSIKIHMGEND